jgi:hypothetical protein
VIWLDAHDDFATPATTQSGFLDGMGLATLAGQGWERLAASIPGFRPIAEARIMHVGGREITNIAEPKAAVIPAADIRANGVQCGHRRRRHRCRFRDRHPGRFQRDCMRRSGYIFGKCAKPAVGEIPEHVIARLKLRDVPTYRRNPPRDISTKDLKLRHSQPCR